MLLQPPRALSRVKRWARISKDRTSFNITGFMNDSRASTAAAMDPVSPCVSICVLDEYGYCYGCERHIDEIVEWPALTADRKRGIIAALPARRLQRGAPEA
jgi:predicted Fe-S protein YdhL (DUF1289 family)